MEKLKRQIISALLKRPCTFWELITMQDQHLARFTELMREMKEQDLLVWGDTHLKLSEKGKQWAGEINLKERQEVSCTCCEGRSVVRNERFEEVFKKMNEVLQRRPRAVADYDQGPVDLDTLIARLMVMYNRADLENQQLFILGDDDLTGIAAALSGLPERVVVLEVDERLVEYINGVAKEEGLTNLEAGCYDVREPLPDEVSGCFDTFFVDPVETVQGILLFVNRCVQALRGEGSSGYFGLTHLEASRKKWHLLQGKFLDMNMVITDIQRNFQWYELYRESFVQSDYPLVTNAPGKLPVPERNWYSSDLYRLEAIAPPRTSSLEIPEGRELYFDDEAYATLP